MSSARSDLGAGIAIGIGGSLIVALMIGGVLWIGWRRASSARMLASSATLPMPYRPEIAEAGGLKVELGPSHGTNVIFSRGSETFVFTPPADEFCEHPVVSSDGRTAYVVSMRNMGGGAATSVCITRFEMPPGPLGALLPDRILTRQRLATLLVVAWAEILDLERVASSGRHLLVRVQQPDPKTSSASNTLPMDRSYWYDLETDTLSEVDR